MGVFRATKSSPDDKVGFTMRQVGKEVRVVKVNPDGLFPKIQKGQVITLINNQPVHEVKAAFEMLKESSLEIEVKNSNVPLDEEQLSLLVEVVSCRDLLIGDRTASDPYVKIILGDKDLHKTKHLIQT